MNAPPYLCFYGDDFTGSTDVLDALSKAGLRTVLFPDIPDASMLQSLGSLDALGIAGMSRTMTTDTMARALPPIYRWMVSSGASILHYKICSTFDSSPRLGSIGKGMEMGATELNAPLIPILVGVPELGRYCVFGSLFARAGIHSEIYRLDRHPVMSQHPVTPMLEADLRRHLSMQTNMNVDLVSVIDIETGALPPENADTEGAARAVLFDTISTDHLRTIGQWLHRAARQSRPLFCVGSSAVEYALIEQWPRRNSPLAYRANGIAGNGAPIAVVSGSCSAITARQIDFAAKCNFELIPVSAIALASAETAQAVQREAVRTARSALERGHSALLYTSRGAPDRRLGNETRIGEFLGEILAEIIEVTRISRVAVAGGDTAGSVAQRLGIEALEVAAPLSPGAPLCLAHRGSRGALQIALKGGQMGADDYFVRVRDAA